MIIEENPSENPEASAPEPIAPSALKAQAEQAKAREAEEQPRQQEQPKRELPTSIPYTRFSSVVAEKNQAKAEAAELKRQIAELQGRFQAPQQDDDFPDPAAFSSKEEYREAARQYSNAQAASTASRHSQQIQQTMQEQAEIQSLVGGFNAQAQAMAQTNPQIVEAVQMFASLEGEFHPEVFRAIVAEGPSLVWDIATNQEALDKLIGASPLQAGRILASLGATPSGGKPQAIKPTTSAAPRAPVPVTKTVSGAARVPETDPAKMTREEYRAYRLKQEN